MGGSTLVVTMAAVLAGVVGSAVLAWSASERLDATAVVRGLCAAGGVGIAALVLLSTGDTTMFGMIHLGYLGLTVSVPILGVAILGAAFRHPHGRGPVVFGAVLLVPAVIGFYATHIEPNRLRVQRVAIDVAADRIGGDPVRIAVLADLQTNRVGSFERRAIDRVMATKPDVILVPGDLFQATEEEFVRALPALRRLLARLRAPGGVFAVQGDVDGGDRVDRAFATNDDARVLADEIVTVRVRDRVLRIGGTGLSYESPAARRVKEELAADPEDESFRILLSHRPDTVFGLDRDSRVDLTVAGHTHGGQVVVPFVGPIMTMSQVPRSVARGGLHTMDGNRIYVSPGVGMERFDAPQIRFNDPPTIGLLELRDRRPG